MVAFFSWRHLSSFCTFRGNFARSSSNALAGTGLPSSSMLAPSAVPAAISALDSSCARLSSSARASSTRRAAIARRSSPSNSAGSIAALPAPFAPPLASPSASASAAPSARLPCAGSRQGWRCDCSRSAVVLYPHCIHTLTVSSKYPLHPKLDASSSARLSRPFSHIGQTGSAPCRWPSTHAATSSAFVPVLACTLASRNSFSVGMGMFAYKAHASANPLSLLFGSSVGMVSPARRGFFALGAPPAHTSSIASLSASSRSA
mmetsp:Transcript_17392/g.44973  ORF Transcript_17392/g.44973 Transcript_17392/m.44973 type:complete len:261 (+) Transcript_17392:490-1272(+)